MNKTKVVNRKKKIFLNNNKIAKEKTHHHLCHLHFDSFPLSLREQL